MNSEPDETTLRKRVDGYVARLGHEGAARALGVARATVYRVLRGETVQRVTEVAMTATLDKLDAGDHRVSRVEHGGELLPHDGRGE